MHCKEPPSRLSFPRCLVLAALAAFGTDDCHVTCFSNQNVLPPYRRSCTFQLRADASAGGLVATDGTDALRIDVTNAIMVSLNDDQRIASELTERVEQMRAGASEAAKIEENSKEQHRRNNYMNVRRRRLAKEIWRDWDGALDLLVQHYPFFDTSSPSVPMTRKEDMQLDGKALSATIEVLGRSDRLDEAMLLLDQTADVFTLLYSMARANNNFIQMKQLEADMRSCYKNALSAAGNCGRWRIGLMLLQQHMSERTGLYPNAEAYHTLIACCRKCGATDAALCLLTEMECGRVITSFSVVESLSRPVPKVDRLAYITAIMACSQEKRCDDAANILVRMKRRGLEPAISEYNQVLCAYAKAGGRHKDALSLLTKMEDNPNVDTNSETYDIVIRCCGKDAAWNEASRIMKRIGKSPTDNKGAGKSKILSGTRISKENSYDYSNYYDDLNRLPKLGKGKDVYWEIGRYSRSDSKDSEIIVGVQPHRNPKKNGISLVFMDASNTTDKLGFMLLRHSLGDKGADDNDDGSPVPMFSALIGMLVDEEHRGTGLSSTFVAIWLQLCLDLGVYPRAEVMKKPLISAALAKFGFKPLKGGVPVEIAPISAVSNQEMKWEATVAIYSPKHQSLGGIYRERDLRVQKLVVASDPPSPRGTLVHLGAGFHHPIYDTSCLPDLTCHDSKEKLERDVDTVLRRSDGSLRSSLNDDFDLLKKALFGFAR
mmetsp:Transcript_23574/g.67893  ORF Transcript_23574/g.67893 Transcript_23574/m.67893 type:complete len:714 (+) Transcript_23574:119-2260(+)